MIFGPRNATKAPKHPQAPTRAPSRAWPWSRPDLMPPRRPTKPYLTSAVHGEFGTSANSDGTVTVHHALQGEAAAFGCDGWAEPNYGTVSVGQEDEAPADAEPDIDMTGTFSDASISAGPSSPTVDLPDDLSLANVADDPYMSVIDHVWDPVAAGNRVGAERHPFIGFGFEREWMSAINTQAAPIVGCDMGCDDCGGDCGLKG